MSCYAPVTAYYSKQIGKTGKRQLTFSRSLAYFPAPLKLPCGKCIGCLTDRGKQWALRCEHERKLHEKNCFITLTYDPEKIPKGHTLRKRDLQLFMKRLRKNLHPEKVRFYACGEYGTQNYRPHYHILLFGWAPNLSDRKTIRRNKDGSTLYSSVQLTRLWSAGHVVIGDVSHGSCLYVASYLSKNFGCKREFDVTCSDGEIIRREKEFSVMSRRPGLGHGYVEKFGRELVDHDNVIVEGREAGLPRYYDNQLVKQEFRTADDLLEIKDSRRRENRRFKKDATPDRLKVREKHKMLTLKHFQKGDL